MDKQPAESFRAGLSAIADLPGIIIIGEPAWDPAEQLWSIHCRISAAVSTNGDIPPVTDWYVRLDDYYPDGCIGIYPAKVGGITQTFPHQNYNAAGCSQQPWRTGKLCTWTNIAPLNRKGYDAEPGEPESNLSWHLERTQQWLELASRNELTLPGDPFELPYIPNHNRTKIAFCEGASNLILWQENNRLYGTAVVKTLESNPSITVITRFNAGHRPSIEQEWRKTVGVNKKQPAVWIRTDRVPVLPPWQMPATWGELREAYQRQGANMDGLLQQAIGRRHIYNTPLLIGFPIPDKIGGPNLRMHWLALTLPDNPARPGFRDNQQGR